MAEKSTKKKTVDKEEQLLLLKEVAKLVSEGMNQKQIAKKLGFKTTFTLNNRLVKASQNTGTPIPPFKKDRKGPKGKKTVEIVVVKRRGKGTAYGVNVPQDPLDRAKFKEGDKLKVNVRGKVITLSLAK